MLPFNSVALKTKVQKLYPPKPPQVMLETLFWAFQPHFQFLAHGSGWLQSCRAVMAVPSSSQGTQSLLLVWILQCC